MIALRSKAYSLIVFPAQLEQFCKMNIQSMKLKGINKSARDLHLTHEKYRDCLVKNKNSRVEMHSLRSEKHKIHHLRQVKCALVNFDDKRYIKEDGLTTLAHGHYSLTK